MKCEINFTFQGLTPMDYGPLKLLDRKSMSLQGSIFAAQARLSRGRDILKAGQEELRNASVSRNPSDLETLKTEIQRRQRGIEESEKHIAKLQTSLEKLESGERKPISARPIDYAAAGYYKQLSDVQKQNIDIVLKKYPTKPGDNEALRTARNIFAAKLLIIPLPQGTHDKLAGCYLRPDPMIANQVFRMLIETTNSLVQATATAKPTDSLLSSI